MEEKVIALVKETPVRDEDKYLEGRLTVSLGSGHSVACVYVYIMQNNAGPAGRQPVNQPVYPFLWCITCRDLELG